MARKKSKQQEVAEFIEAVKDMGPIDPKAVKKKRKKKENPHKREYGIEVIHNNHDDSPILHKVSIDIGFTTSGLTHYDVNKGKVQSLYYKKDKECHVKGMKIVDLLNLCDETLDKYIDLLPDEVVDNLSQTQFILEEPLVIAGQKSFSISLYVLLGHLIRELIQGFDVHSIVLVRPGSAKKLLGYKSNVHMPDGEKTKFIKDKLPSWDTRNNHTADSNFSMILTNQEELKELYPALKILNTVDYKVYNSQLSIGD